jgi:hypothetical protein
MAEAKWYPSPNQLGKPEDLERAFREVLRMHYSLSRQVKDMADTQAKLPMAGTKASQVPHGNTAAVTNILGLPIEPSDTTQLADGTSLKYVAATRSFKFLP